MQVSKNAIKSTAWLKVVTLYFYIISQQLYSKCCALVCSHSSSNFNIIFFPFLQFQSVLGISMEVDNVNGGFLDNPVRNIRGKVVFSILVYVSHSSHSKQCTRLMLNLQKVFLE